MKVSTLKFRGDRCFTKNWAGFEEYKSINIIIGRNNVGKSQLIELVRVSCDGLKTRRDDAWEYQASAVLGEEELRRVFLQNHEGGALRGNHWYSNGLQLVGVPITWEMRSGCQPHSVKILEGYVPPEGMTTPVLSEGRISVLSQLLSNVENSLQGRRFSHLAADRDVRRELASVDLELDANGQGATNIIRRHINSASLNFPSETIQTKLRKALNTVFGVDGSFNRIEVKQHDDGDGTWEVYLGEEHKGLVALSASGSGLKTVILVLLHLLVVPKLRGGSEGSFVYAFEELENNLHPALQRRLLKFIEEYALQYGVIVFLTTHSSVALDAFSGSENAQVLFVEHDGIVARTRAVTAHFDRLGIVADLGARPSDLMQANGVIWVEGPSDVIYLNRWIELFSGAKFREGRDYACAFYGGALLARAQFVGLEEAEREFANLLSINPNVIVVCDSDRLNESDALKPRVQKVKDQIDEVPGAVLWITKPKEIESYLSGDLFGRVQGTKALADPGQYELMFPKEVRDGTSYVERVLQLKSLDKIKLAACAAKIMTIEDMAPRFDWEVAMKGIVSTIERWNR